MSENKFKIINVRVTFKNLPIHKLERFRFNDPSKAFESFKKIPGVSECVIVQTHSRVEVFVVNNLQETEAPDVRRIEGKGLVINKIKETWLSLIQLDQYDIDHLDQIIEVYENADVYLHLLRLASGIDSIVVGNEEVLQEIKESISRAKMATASGRILNKLFDNSVLVATRIRDSTGISKGVKSIGDVAVKIAEDSAGLDAKKKILLIGTGETATMVAKCLNKKAYPFEICSMTIERAIGFSKVLGGKPIAFEEVLLKFDKFDIIFVATTVDYFLISLEKIKILMENKKSGTMMLDVSDPRAVDDNLYSLPGLRLMFRDQISEMEDVDMKSRKSKVIEVEKLISKEVPIIEATLKRLEPEPTVTDVFSSVDSLRRKELEKALQKLGETDQEKIKVLDELTKTIVESIISAPANSAKKSS